MLAFNQGLPGSGKSFDAMVKHIIPALQKGREVWCYIEGLNHEKIAEVAELPVDDVRKLLHQLTRDDVKAINKLATKNSLIVIDEAQNFWPSIRQPLSPEMTQFVAEHRHEGMDIILMGQLMKDVHTLWRGRIAQVVTFNKLDALGAEKRYRWVLQKATAPGKFANVSEGIAKYDTKYFGTYASHTSDEVQTGNYKDARANLLLTGWFRYGLVAALSLLGWGGFTAWRFFHPVEVAPSVVAKAVAPVALPPVRQEPPAKAIDKSDFVAGLNAAYRPRLAMLWTIGQRSQGVVEWYEGEERREVLTFAQIEALGSSVMVRGARIVLVGGQWVTPWPLASHGATATPAPAVQTPTL